MRETTELRILQGARRDKRCIMDTWTPPPSWQGGTLEEATAQGHSTPTVLAALYAVQDADIPTDLRAERINIRCLESGEVAFRCHPAGGGDYVGGVVRAEETEPF